MDIFRPYVIHKPIPVIYADSECRPRLLYDHPGYIDNAMSVYHF